MSGPQYERWHVFVYTPKMNDIYMNGYKVLENKYIYISDKNVSKNNFTYALFQIWICSSQLQEVSVRLNLVKMSMKQCNLSLLKLLITQ